MLSHSPLAEHQPEPPSDLSDKPYDLNTEIPPAEPPTPPIPESEFVMGPRQMASLAFVGILILAIMSAVAYFAGRKNTSTPQVTERVIERVVQAPAPTPAIIPEVKPVLAAVPKPLPVPDNQPNAEVTAPILNRTYLQAGSVEVGLAELLVEGLRKRGIPAIVGIGITSKVARILVGPFNSPAEQQAAQKAIEAMGFHPYPRSFTAKDLEQQQPSPDKP